jgi:phosphoglycolate phosphatase-like HAD superfamily hydrolase
MTDLNALKNLKPTKDYFIGIDSDGCAFDSMEIKQKECFIPQIIKHWKLQAVSKYARAAAEFVNLYSQWRGVNRFPALIKTLDLLKDWPAAMARNAQIPEAASLREWIGRETKLGNPSLKAEVARTGDPVLTQTLEWSEAVNNAVADIVEGVPPFPFICQSMEKAQPHADMVVVSATPCEALEREWKEHKIDGYVSVIAGQEMGNKTEHLQMTTGDGKYKQGHVLMIGDAPGDMKAARANNALFYPINPGGEEASWERFYNEALDKFLSDDYVGAYEQKLVDEFQAMLPSTPPWKKEG